jgi:[protein-PII] uridylyltransferase
VYAGDRPGLLFAIANSLHRLGIEIHLAKINTYVNRVLDVFYVTDSEGHKIESEGALAGIKTRILDQVREPDEPRAEADDDRPSP